MVGSDPLPVGRSRRWSRRSLLGVVTGSLLLSGCVVETPRSGPVVPTPTAPGAGGPVAQIQGTPGRWAGRELRVSAAGDVIAEQLRTVLWLPFAAATGCRLVVGYTDYGALSDGNAAVDLALVDDRWALRLAAADLLAEVDPTGTDGTVTDLLPASRFVVPAYANAIVSTYRIDAVGVDDVPVDWAAWWQSRSLPGNRTLAKGPFGTFEFALLADGVPPGKLYPLDLERAIGSLRRISGSIVDRWWETVPQAIDWLSSGRATFGTTTANAVVLAQRAGRPIQPVWNQGLLYGDCWIVPAGAGNAEIARDFIRFALSAAAQASLATAAGLAPVSSAGLAPVDPLLRVSLATDPTNLPRLIRSNTEWWVDNESAALESFNGWLLGHPRARD